jgi:hypothetical protein
VRIYIAGPMTGIPQFNIPAFDAAADHLRSLGHDVVSPAELDDPETRAAALISPDGAPGAGSANGETWGDFLARDVKLITDGGIEAIAVIPGWDRSRGARLETFVGYLNGLPTYYYKPHMDVTGPLVPISPIDMYRAWTRVPNLSINTSFGSLLSHGLAATGGLG